MARLFVQVSETEARAGIAHRLVSPVDLVEAVRACSEAVDDKMHSYVTVVAERTRAEARAAETDIATANWRGPLHGIPFDWIARITMSGSATAATNR